MFYLKLDHLQSCHNGNIPGIPIIFFSTDDTHFGKCLCTFLLLSRFSIWFNINFLLKQGGFSVKSIKVENCGKNNVIKVNDGATVQLLPNCDVVPNGCGETSGFKTASVRKLLLLCSMINSMINFNFLGSG